MKIFNIIQRHYATLGIGSSNQSHQEHRLCFGVLLFATMMLTHFVYIFRVADGFMDYMVCICSTSASFILLVCFAAIAYRRTTLFESIDRMEKLIIIKCKCPKSRSFFLETNRQVERLSEIVFTVVLKVELQCFMLPKCIFCLGVYIFTDSGSDSFELPVPLWFPFDSNNPSGYLAAIILEYIIIGYEFFVIACTLALSVAVTWFTISTAHELKRSLHVINVEAQPNEIESNELKILISEFIHAHATIKQVVFDFSDVFQPIIVSLFTWSLFAISGALLIIQVEIVHHGNVMPLLLTILSGICALATVFVTCELGQRMTDAFKEIHSTLGQFDWYLFPIEMQKMLLVIVANAQDSVSMECFASITCIREVFKNIIHRAFSYFMVLRKLGG